MSLPASLDELKGLRSALWIRESTQGQFDAFGPDAQREQYAQAIERYGLNDTGIAWSVAHSGRTVGGTGQFADMRQRAGSEFDVLVVGYVSRFARDLRTAVNARHDLHSAGAAILFADERLLTSDERSWEEWAREAVEAESYSRRLGRRIREGLDSKWRRYADQAGPAPLGFRRRAERPRVLEIDPDTIGKVVALYERYATGVTPIVELAAEVGMNDRALNEILKNPIYNGWVRMKGELLESAWRTNPPISDDLWARVERLRADRSFGGGPRRSGRVDLLAGLVRCPEGHHVRADGRSKSQYRRRHARECGSWVGPAVVPAHFYEDAIVAQVDQLSWNNEQVAQVVASLPTVPMRNEVSGQRIKKQLRDLALRHAEGRITDEDYIAQSGRLREQQNMPQEPTGSPRTAEEVVRGLRHFQDAWRTASPEKKSALIHQVYKQITVSGREFVGVDLTPEARELGMQMALPEQVVIARPTGVRFSITIPITGRDQIAREQSA